MTERYMRELAKKVMRERCGQLGIAIPPNATKRQLEATLDTYFKDAVVVHTERGVDLRQTDRPTAEYIVEFTISGFHRVRAESEAAAREWVEEQVSSNYDAGNCEYDYAEVTDWQIGDSYLEDEGSQAEYMEVDDDDDDDWGCDVPCHCGYGHECGCGCSVSDEVLEIKFAGCDSDTPHNEAMNRYVTDHDAFTAVVEFNEGAAV